MNCQWYHKTLRINNILLLLSKTESWQGTHFPKRNQEKVMKQKIDIDPWSQPHLTFSCWNIFFFNQMIESSDKEAHLLLFLKIKTTLFLSYVLVMHSFHSWIGGNVCSVLKKADKDKFERTFPPVAICHGRPVSAPPFVYIQQTVPSHRKQRPWSAKLETFISLSGTIIQ